MTCVQTVSLGAYLLGALDPRERAEYEAHLAGCDVCRAELARLAPLPGLLHQIGLADFEEEPAPDLIEPAPAAVLEFPEPVEHRPAKRRRPWALAAAAVLVVVLSVGGVVVYESLRSPAAPIPVAVSWSATDVATGVRADVELTDRAWGTEVRIRLHDVPPGKPCKLVVRGRDGAREVAGWWGSTYDQDEQIPGSTSVDLSKISALQVVTDDDKVLVNIPAPS